MRRASSRVRRRWRAEPVSWASSLARLRWWRASSRSPVTCRAAARSQRRLASARVKVPSMRLKCGGEFTGGFGVAEVDEAVSAPAGQMGEVEGEVGQFLAAGAVADLAGRDVEGAAAVGLLPCGGGHLPLGRAQPAADLVRDRGVGVVVGGADHVQGLVAAVEVEQHISLLPRGERQQAGVARFPRRGGGSFEVSPGGGKAPHVDGLPSSEG